MPITELPRREAGKVPEEGPKGRQRRSLSVEDLSLWSPEELLELRAQIDARLPVRSLKQVNLEQELVFQLLAVQRLQSEVLTDEGVPANQRSQTAGQVGSTIQMLSSLQEKIYTSERLKRIEGILIETLNVLPREAQEQFIEAYEKALGAINA